MFSLTKPVDVATIRLVSSSLIASTVLNLVFFSPSGIDSLMKNFPDFATSHKDVAIATFGPATAKAAKEAGLRLDLEAPTEKYPSMTGALQHYLIVNGDD